MWLVLLLILGLVFGSFVNVLVYRLPLGISIMGRSFCPKCKKQIAWFDNIPLLSFLLLKGKCRKCGKRISWRYPLVELITALGFVTFYELIGFKDIVYLGFLLVIFCVFLAVFAIDLEKQIIPDSLVFFAYIISFILLLFGGGSIYSNLLAGYSAGLFLLLLHLLTRGRGMGLGDVKLALVGGTILGFTGGLIWMYLAFLTGALVGIILILLGKAKFGKHIAFGPFLILAFWLTLFWGDKVFQWIF